MGSRPGLGRECVALMVGACYHERGCDIDLLCIANSEGVTRR